MKVAFSRPNRDGWITLHFNRELPLAPMETGPLPFMRSPAQLSRATRLQRLAVRMAETNRGRFVVELGNPVLGFLRFLEELVFLPGVEQVGINGRYRMEVRIGGLFAPREVANTVADCVRRHFYPEEELAVRPLRKKSSRSRLPER